MPLSDAQRKAMAKWQKNNTTVVTVRLQHSTDKDILEYFHNKSKATTIKAALREYMKNHPDPAE